MFHPLHFFSDKFVHIDELITVHYNIKTEKNTNKIKISDK